MVINTEGWCNEATHVDGYVCVRLANHDGLHVAESLVGIVAVWNNNPYRRYSKGSREFAYAQQNYNANK